MEHPFSKLPLILATGQGRSGTTVLTKALAEHRDIYSNRVESNVMHDVLIAGVNSTTMQSRINQMVVPRETHDAIFHQMLLSLLFPLEKSPRSDPRALSTFSAMNSEIAPYLVKIFPKVHFANIVRNGIEVVASRMVHRTMKAHSFEEQCVAWADAVDMAQWGKDRNDFSLVRHEALLDPEQREQAFNQLLQRAGLENDPACAQYVEQNTHNQTSYAEEENEASARLAARKERWRYWDDLQRQIFEQICGPAMKYFGYPIPW